MTRVHVISSDLESVGYDPAASVLEIRFNSGGIYRYSPVPESVYLGLIRATSKGRFFHANIEGRYSTQRIV
jgi:hypothetical protein